MIVVVVFLLWVLCCLVVGVFGAWCSVFGVRCALFVVRRSFLGCLLFDVGC